jgi:superoxide reductase
MSLTQYHNDIEKVNVRRRKGRMIMHNSKFYVCAHCGNVIIKAHDSGVPIICCGEEMQEMVPNTVDASHEKHVPVVATDDAMVVVKVGSVPHPMTEEHHIEWIYLVGKKSTQTWHLNPGDEPTATFSVIDDTPVAAYAYCNLHGLWKADI